MTAEPRHLRSLVDQIEDEIKAIRAVLGTARDAQWMRPRQTDAERAASRQKGTHSDPTGETAVDPVRLRLRDAVRRSDVALHGALGGLRGSRRALEGAMRRWDGEREEG